MIKTAVSIELESLKFAGILHEAFIEPDGTLEVRLWQPDRFTEALIIFQSIDITMASIEVTHDTSDPEDPNDYWYVLRF